MPRSIAARMDDHQYFTLYVSKFAVFRPSRPVNTIHPCYSGFRVDGGHKCLSLLVYMDPHLSKSKTCRGASAIYSGTTAHPDSERSFLPLPGAIGAPHASVCADSMYTEHYFM